MRKRREYQEGDTALRHPNSYPSFLAVILSRIRANEKRVTEHFLLLGEVVPMGSKVGAILRLVPLEDYCSSKCSYTQKWLVVAFLRLEYLVAPDLSVTDVTDHHVF